MSETKKSLLSRLPAISVLALLALIAVWGHRSGWKAAKISEIFGHDEEKKEDWCGTHNVTQSRCIACDPKLIGADPKDWCKEHGVAESKCTACHPEILTKGKASDWCREHGVPESSCTLCNPGIAVKSAAPKPDDDAPAVSRSQDAKSAPDPALCQTHHLRVQFASPASVKKSGIKLAAVEERPMVAAVDATGEAEYDPTRHARLASRSAGTLWRVEKQIGDAVKQGDVLALIDSADVGRAKSDLIQAAAQVQVRDKALQRIKASADQGFRTQAELQESEASLREARIRVSSAQQALSNLGLTLTGDGLLQLPEDQLLERLRRAGLPESLQKDAAITTANLLPIIAPFDGVVIGREGVAGEVVDPSKPLFVVADPRRMELVLDVRLEDAARLAVGQEVHFRVDGAADEVFLGKVRWIATALEEKTRTVRLRAPVENPDGKLRAHSFGTARVVVRRDPKAIAVPDEAVQWEGCCHVVFVRVSDELFQTRKIRLGAKNRGYTEIVVGLVPGEVVASTGSQVLKSDILKSRLGAGCVDD